VSKHAVLEANLGKDVPVIRANAARLRQIVMNLVTNASEAIGDRDGVIRVTTKGVRIDGDWSEMPSAQFVEGEYVLLEVSDTGRGIPPELQAKVFDPFFTTKSAGHGLGLSIVEGIVRSLGGTIHVTSAPSKGTAFRILLPCATDNPETTLDRGPVPEEPALSEEEATILVVEDEGPLRQPLVKVLRKNGFKVFEAADGSSAIDFLRANRGKIDVILLDVTIPGASSEEVVLEAAHIRSEIKVILASAYSQDMIADSMRAPQIRCFIRKPYRLREVIETLRHVLSQ
jgi:CheY-like chemotaxis protein